MWFDYRTQNVLIEAGLVFEHEVFESNVVWFSNTKCLNQMWFGYRTRMGWICWQGSLGEHSDRDGLWERDQLSVFLYLFVFICIYICIMCIYICVYVVSICIFVLISILRFYIYIYIYRERERERIIYRYVLFICRYAYIFYTCVGGLFHFFLHFFENTTTRNLRNGV